MNHSDALTLSDLPADIVRKFIPLMGSKFGEMRLVSKNWERIVRLHFCYLKTTPPIDVITIRDFPDNFSVLFKIAAKNALYYLPLMSLKTGQQYRITNTPEYKYLSITTDFDDVYLKRLNQCMLLNATTVDFEANDAPEHYSSFQSLMSGSKIREFHFIKNDLKNADKNQIISIMSSMDISMFCFEIQGSLQFDEGGDFLLEVAAHVEGIGINHRYGYLFGISEIEISTLFLKILGTGRKTSAIWIPSKFKSELDDSQKLEKFATDVASLGKKVWMVIATECTLRNQTINQHSIWTNSFVSFMYVKHMSRREEQYTW